MITPLGRDFGLGILVGRGQREVEPAAFAWGAFGPDAAIVLLDDAAAKRQAQAGSAQCAGVGGVALLEAFEDTVEFFGSNAAALIFNGEEDRSGTLGALVEGLRG